MTKTSFRYVYADAALKNQVAVEWGEKTAQHMHISDGFSLVVVYDEMLIGLISVYWKKLPSPLENVFDGYIDILEVHKEFRRKGIATRLIERATKRAKEQGAYQMRAWSSEDKIEAIPMWKALGFGLCPAVTFPGQQEVKGFFVTKPL